MNKIKVINTEKAPAALGPYSQAIEVKGTLYVSGQIPFIPETMTCVSDDVQEQTKQSAHDDDHADLGTHEPRDSHAAAAELEDGIDLPLPQPQ